jgi:hypothetical protein
MKRALWWFMLRNSVAVPPRRTPFWMRMIPWRTRYKLLTGPLRPSVELPRFETPRIEIPRFDVPKMQVPSFDVPRMQVPSFDVPRMQVPTFDLPRFGTPRMDVPRFEVPTRGRTRFFGLSPALTPLLLAGVGGIALAYFLDPDMGTRRRKMAFDRTMGFVRRQARYVGRIGRAGGAEVYGLGQKAVHEVPSMFRSGETPDDVTLARKVESAIARGTDCPSGRINVSAENGFVVLVGEVDRYDQIESCAAAARAVPGVKGVDNLLHLPGTPAPTKSHMVEARS